MDADREYCPRCGRRMPHEGRRQRSRYCSRRCRQTRLNATDTALEAAIRDLLTSRQGSACPSEAARRVRPDDWRPLMERARQAARRLWLAGEIEILQRGRPVEPSTARGPIRLRRRRGFSAAGP